MSQGRGSRAPARGRRRAQRCAALHYGTQSLVENSEGNALPTELAFTLCRGRGREEPLRFRHKTATRQAAPSSNLDFRKDFGAGECTATGCAGDLEILLPFFRCSAKALGTGSLFRSDPRATQRASQPPRVPGKPSRSHFSPHCGH